MAKVGPYIVTETLGQGTFGKVKLAKHKDTNVEYAIKILEKKDIKEQELTLNVRREIAIMKALNHRNIVNLREVLSSKHKLYIVMDLVRGGELFRMIEKKGELDERTARKYFQQLVDGIEYCHRRGVFHRDLKPENLLLDENGILKITDFGVSSVKKKEGDLLYTAVGTPYYCAPEILSNSPDGYNGEKVDSWSCGVILYLLLVGELPFYDKEMNILYEMIKQCKVQYPSSLSAGSKDLLSKMLVRDPAKRFNLSDVKQNAWFLVDYDPFLGGSVNSLGEDPSLLRSRSGQTGEMDNVRSNSAHLTDRIETMGNGSGSKHGSTKEASIPQINNGQSRTSVTAEEDSAVDIPKTVSGTGSGFSRVPGSIGAKGGFPQYEGLEKTGSFNSNTTPTFQVTELASKYEGKEMIDFVRDALPGKPEKKLSDIVDKLSDIDIDCVEDVQAVAETMTTPESFRKWLESEANLPAVTSMRICKMFFPQQG